MLFALLLLFTQPVFAQPADPSWIWIDGEGPPHWAPAEPRYFRRIFDVAEIPSQAIVKITADDEFEAFLNGQTLGIGKVWDEMYKFDLTPFLKTGKNILAVRVQSSLPGPGGLLVQMTGLPDSIVSDNQFKVSKLDAPDWDQLEFDDSNWAPVMVIGPVGCPPWGDGPKSLLKGSNTIENIVKNYRADDPVMVAPTPRGEIAKTRTVSLVSDKSLTVNIQLVDVKQDFWAYELLNRALTAQGYEVAYTNSDSRITLTLDSNAGFTEQQYEIGITPQKGAQLRASTATGLGYAAATLVQLMRVDNGQLMAPQASINDAPACEYRGPISVPNSPDWLDFCAFFKLNSWFPGANGSRQIAEEANRRGIRLMLARHLPDEYDFQSEEQLEELAQWALAGAENGYRWVTINADDRPNEVYTEADKQRYGTGYAGLGKAHAEFINKLKQKLGDKIELVFCPRVYYEVGADYNDAEAKDQHDYLDNLSAGLDSPLSCWITQVTPQYLRQSAERFKTLPLAWHNYFPGDTTDWKIYYEAYPIVKETDVARGYWVLGNVYAADLWRPNYITVAGNTWNPSQPVGLREAFRSMFGVKAGDMLTEYAVLAGGHDKPIGVLADFWDQPREVAARYLGSGWGGIIPKEKPSEAVINECSQLSESALQAAQLPLEEAGVPAEMAQRLRTEARRTHLAFALWAARYAKELNLPVDAVDVVAKKTELNEILTSLHLDATATDWALTR